MRSDSGLQISVPEFCTLDSLFRFCYTSPGVASCAGYCSDIAILLYPILRPSFNLLIHFFTYFLCNWWVLIESHSATKGGTYGASSRNPEGKSVSSTRYVHR